MAEFARLHAHRCTATEKAALERLIFGAQRPPTASPAPGPGSTRTSSARARCGSPSRPVSPSRQDTSILLVEVPSVGRHEPLTREKLCPVLAVLRAGTPTQGISLAEQMVELDGLGHSAAIHTDNEELAIEFGRRVKAVRIIRDSPTSHGRDRRRLQRLHPVADPVLRILRA